VTGRRPRRHPAGNVTSSNGYDPVTSAKKKFVVTR